jgi:hypothetical protein
MSYNCKVNTLLLCFMQLPTHVFNDRCITASGHGHLAFRRQLPTFAASFFI